MNHYLITPPWPFDAAAIAALPGAKEVLLGHRDLARFGRFDEAGLEEAVGQSLSTGLRPILVWDALADDALLQTGMDLLSRLLPLGFSALRVQDMGVAAQVRERYPDLPLQLILETGNHNQVGIAAWVRELKPERVALSNELPLTQVTRICSQLSVGVEVQVLGRLLIFYTPRGLLHTPLALEDTPEFLERYATEEESRKQFPVLENHHGTFMFYEKDLDLLQHGQKWLDAGVVMQRLDLTFYEPAICHALGAYLEDPNEEHRQALNTFMAPKRTQGFFKSNRTDKQFKKLRNSHLRIREDRCLVGTVLESRKKHYTALHSETPFSVGDQLAYVVPEGDELLHRVTRITRSNGEEVTCAETPGLWLINHARAASSGTLFYTVEE